MTGLAVAALTFSALLAHAQVGGEPTWRISKILPALQNVEIVTASGPGNAWAAGINPASSRLYIEHWYGRAWHHIEAPPRLGKLPYDSYVTVGSSSPRNAWFFAATQAGARPHTFALHWSNGTWTARALPRDVSISDTAVLGPADAWAFGFAGSGYQQAPYDLRWDGKTWQRVRLPAAPYEVSALAPDQIWALATATATLNKPANKQVTDVIHWNGRRWTTLRVPVPPPARGGFLDAYIAAGGPRNFWFAYINFDRNFNFRSNGLLHWSNGHWQRLRLPADFTVFLNGAAQDGHGGLWVCSPDQIYHYAQGHWSAQHMAGKDPACNHLAWIPHTHSAWIAGAIRTADLHLQGAIFRFAQ